MVSKRSVFGRTFDDIIDQILSVYPDLGMDEREIKQKLISICQFVQHPDGNGGTLWSRSEMEDLTGTQVHRFTHTEANMVLRLFSDSLDCGDGDDEDSGDNEGFDEEDSEIVDEAVRDAELQLMAKALYLKFYEPIDRAALRRAILDGEDPRDGDVSAWCRPRTTEKRDG